MEKSFTNCLTLILGLFLLISGGITSSRLIKQGFDIGFNAPFTAKENTGSTQYVRRYGLGGTKTVVTTTKSEMLFPAIMMMLGLILTAGTIYQFKKENRAL